jgi:DNA-binding MarR family transcriptional regulator
LRREASQRDARRIVVVATPLGQRLVAELKAQKLAIIEEIVAEWPRADIEIFARLFDEFMSGFERVFAMRDSHLPPPPGLEK